MVLSSKVWFWHLNAGIYNEWFLSNVTRSSFINKSSSSEIISTRRLGVVDFEIGRIQFQKQCFLDCKIKQNIGNRWRFVESRRRMVLIVKVITKKTRWYIRHFLDINLTAEVTWIRRCVNRLNFRDLRSVNLHLGRLRYRYNSFVDTYRKSRNNHVVVDDMILCLYVRYTYLIVGEKKTLIYIYKWGNIK